MTNLGRIFGNLVEQGKRDAMSPTLALRHGDGKFLSPRVELFFVVGVELREVACTCR